MLRNVGRRSVQVVPVLVLVTFAATALTNLIPNGTPGEIVLGPFATKSAVAAFNAKFFYNRPLLDRYWIWLSHAIRGDLGTSVTTDQGVSHLIVSHLAVTFELAIITLVCSLLIAIPVAALSAFHENRLVDRVITAISSVLFAIPQYVSSIALVYLLAVKAGWFPADEWIPLTNGVGPNLDHAFLPILTLVLSITPVFVRVLRGDLVRLANNDFILTARSRGLPEWYVFLRYLLRPASTSLLTVIGLVFGYLCGGSIIVETFFSLPGMGLLFSDSIINKDFTVVQGEVVFVAAAYLVLNIGVDVLHGFIDPRVRSAQ